jgi:hypothetical protein
MGFNLLLLMVYPTFIAPMFNKFKPLDDETLRTRVTGADASMRIRGERAFCHGRQQTQRPCKRLLHRIRCRQTRGFL